VIIIEVKRTLEDRLEAMLEGCFCNRDMKVQAWSQVKGIGHY